MVHAPFDATADARHSIEVQNCVCSSFVSTFAFIPNSIRDASVPWKEALEAAPSAGSGLDRGEASVEAEANASM